MDYITQIMQLFQQPTFVFVASLIVNAAICYAAATRMVGQPPMPMRQYIKWNLESLGGNTGLAILLGLITYLTIKLGDHALLLVYDSGEVSTTRMSQLVPAYLRAGIAFVPLPLISLTVAGVAEEVIMRGVLIMEIKRWCANRESSWYRSPILSTTAAIVISSAVFAASHGSLALSPYFFAAGLVLGVAYRWSGTLWVPIIAHALFNALFVLKLAMGS